MQEVVAATCHVHRRFDTAHEEARAPVDVFVATHIKTTKRLRVFATALWPQGGQASDVAPCLRLVSRAFALHQLPRSPVDTTTGATWGPFFDGGS